MKVCTDACLFGAWCAQELAGTCENDTLLDIGTGTGLLPLMIRQKAILKIDCVEIDAAAAKQAIQNTAASKWPAYIQVFHDDIVTMKLPKQYNYIICNPPFYEKDLSSPDKKRSVAHHSRHLTLSSLVSIINSKLGNDGCFFLLLPYKRRAELHRTVDQNKMSIIKEVLVHQTEKHTPFRIMIQGSRKQAKTETRTIIIADENGKYTPGFTELLKDYYLYL